ncbi:MAG: carbohydrate kinase family protein [Clostridia bacterium]|nr:carbohydrate kinase family protein [Clostridia bacterium]
MRFCVVGGINLDVTGWADTGFRTGDSNPGQIRFSRGGVGGNVAVCLANEGHDVSLVSVLSNDVFGAFLRCECEKSGLDLRCCVTSDAPSSAYMAVHGPDGELVIGLNDMASMNCLTADRLHRMRSFINGHDAVVFDANLSESAIEVLCGDADCPLIADAVSAAKCKRLMGALPYLSALKLNLLEAQTLGGEQTPKDAGQALLRRGVKNVFVSLGREGVYACDKNEDAFLRPQKQLDRPTSGVGDAMCAGIAQGVAMGLGAVKCAALGQDAAFRLLSGR